MIINVKFKTRNQMCTIKNIKVDTKIQLRTFYVCLTDKLLLLNTSHLTEALYKVIII